MQVGSLTIEYQVFQFVPRFNILEQFESKLVTILLQISILRLCGESVLPLTLGRCDLVLQDRPIQDKHLHLDHVRACIYENQDLAGNDRGSLRISS